MFDGKYGFFDWKYSIAGYSGQDYDGMGRYIFLIASLVLLPLLAVIFRKAKHEKIRVYLAVVGIFLTALYIAKTVWESYFDITIGGGFNFSILPFDTCSLIMPAAIIAGFAKGKVKQAADAWLATGGIVGGISNLLFLQALKYYPFWTFGAFYSMIWHFLMVFTGVLMIVTNYVKLDFKTVLYAFIFHMAFSVVVIPIDYIRDVDFMLYRYAGGAPLIEKLGETMAAQNMHWVTTIVMIIAYFGCFCLITYFSLGVKKLVHLIQSKAHNRKAKQE